MRKSIALLIVMTMALWCAPMPLSGQDKDTSDQPSPDKTVSQEKSTTQPEQHDGPVKPYRLDFSFYEVTDGKKVNSRHYSMNLTVGSGPDEIKIGTRVPVPVGPNNSQYQYMDVGTRIWANLREGSGTDTRLEVISAISNLDTSQRPEGRSIVPIVRQIQINGSTLLTTGKPILIGSMDDPNSNREFQLEVTATKLR